MVHSYESQLAKLTHRLQVAESHDELLRSNSKAAEGERVALAKSLKLSEYRAATLESQLKDKEAKEKEAKEREEAKAREVKAKELKEKEAAAAREKVSKARASLLGQIYNSSKYGYLQGRQAVATLSKNATEAVVDAVPAVLSKATGAAKGIASEVKDAAGWMLEAVKHGFEAQSASSA